MAQLAIPTEASTGTSTARQIVVIAADRSTTKIVRLNSVAQSLILEYCSIIDLPIIAETAGPKLIQVAAKRVVEQLGGNCKKVSLLLNDVNGFSALQRVPIGTEHQIRTHLQQHLLQANKTDLTKYVWTVSPLHPASGSEQSLSDVVDNKMNVLVCATRREHVDTVRAAFRKEGYEVDHVFFQLPALLKAFNLFAGNAFEKETVALLHVQATKALIAVIRNGVLFHLHEFHIDSAPTSENELTLQQELKNQLAVVQSKTKSKVRCTFVSADGEITETLVTTLKNHGFYVRSWSALKKISLSTSATKLIGMQLVNDRLNTTIGAALMCEAADKLIRDIEQTHHDEDVDVAELLHKLSRPLAVATALLVAGFIFLWNWNWYSQQQVKLLRAKLKSMSVVMQKSDPAIPLNRRVDELEMFSKSRHAWPPVIAEIRNLNIDGVQLLQLRASDVLTVADVNPFDTDTRGGQRRRLLGALTLEAQNQGGLGALEQFMNEVKQNHAVRPLLSKKKPVRLLNNIQAATEAPDAKETTLFTVEYALDERSF